KYEPKWLKESEVKWSQREYQTMKEYKEEEETEERIIEEVMSQKIENISFWVIDTKRQLFEFVNLLKEQQNGNYHS
ncbi:hypothetical protein LOAG_12065, partial [Loa loa]